MTIFCEKQTKGDSFPNSAGAIQTLLLTSLQANFFLKSGGTVLLIISELHTSDGSKIGERQVVDSLHARRIKSLSDSGKCSEKKGGIVWRFGILFVSLQPTKTKTCVWKST